MATKKTNGAKKKGSKPKQIAIAGTERVLHKDVRSAAEAYVEVRDERMELTKDEVVKKSLLVAVMKKHELSVYRDEEADLEVTLVTDEKCKVKKLSSASSEE